MFGRLTFAMMLLVALGGCRNRPTQLDPFLGKTAVPPPPTGSVGAAPGGLAYPSPPPSSQNPTTVVPNVTTPGSVGTPPTTGSVYGGASPFTPNAGAKTPPPPPVSTPQILSNNGAAPGGASSNPSTQFASSSSSSIRVVPPSSGSPTSPQSLRTPAATGGVDIMDLPVKGQGPKTATGAAHGAPQVYNPSTHSTSATQGPAKTVTLPGRQENYGRDANYTTLNGKLEYSSLDGRWLIRYVSPGEKPDQFGGVAVLVPAGPMTGFRNGDFVTAQGKLQAAGSASPVFTAVQLTPQREAR